MLEARRAGLGTPFAKTAPWSKALQRAAAARGALRTDRPVLFIQSIMAFVPPPQLRYGVYVDRVGREGRSLGTEFVSKFSSGWEEREAAMVRGAHRIYSMGPSTKQALVELYGIEPERVLVVGAGPNMQLGPPGPGGGGRRIVFIGIDWDRKGLPDLYEAFAKVRVTVPDLRLTVVGATPDIEAPPGTEVLGRVPHAQIDEILSNSDILAIPTHYEAFGIALIEALLKHVPVIGTTISNQQWIVGDGGICVEPGNVSELAAAIETIVTDYSSWRARAAERGEHVREQFAWPRIAATILDDLVGPE